MATLKQHDHMDGKRRAGAMLNEIESAKKVEAQAPAPAFEATAISLPPFQFVGENYLANTPPEPKLLIGGTSKEEPKKNALVHQGDKVMLGAESKAGKTWWMLQQALCISSGLPFLGHTTTRGVVLYINFELKPWAFRRRVEFVMRSLGIIDAKGKYKTRVNDEGEEEPDYPYFIEWNLRGKCYDIETICAVAEERLSREPGLKLAAIVIDPLYKSYGGKEENSATDMAAVLENMERFAEKFDAAIFIASHFAKGDSAGKNQIDRISGSGVIARDPDSIMTLSKIKDEKNLYTFEATLRNMACPEPRVVEFEFPLWKVRDDIKAGGKGYDLGALVDLLPEQGLTSNQWFEAASEQGICGKKTNWADLRDRALKNGLVAMKTGPRNSQIFTKTSGTAENK
jgi:hypothetical protein